MRIIAGKYGGRRYSGKLPGGIRPTMDAMKESIFNILLNYIDLEDAEVCDLFAGAGALGFESLSRGAAHCTFVDKSPKATAFIKIVAQTFQIPKDSYSVTKASADKFIENADRQFDIIFADPPYIKNVLSELLIIIKGKNALKSGGIAVFEHEKNITVEAPEGFELIKSKKSGGTIVDFFIYK